MPTVTRTSALTALVISAALGAAVESHAQNRAADPARAAELPRAPHHVEQVRVASGAHDGEGAAGMLAYAIPVRAHGAPWLQLHFADWELGSASSLRLTSLEDGDQQHFNARTLAQWNGSSAYFSGDAVLIELLVAPNDRQVRFSLDRLTVGERVGGLQQVSLCDGDDDRAPATDPRVGRLFCGGCTGYLISNGAVLTAGHCAEDFTAGTILEFNVPASDPDGTPNCSAVQDQYPLGGYLAWWNDGDGQLGRDWGVFTVNPNANTGLTAHVVQGFVRCTRDLPGDGFPLRVTGYGADSTPLTRNFTEQTDTGSFEGESSDSDGIWVRHRADTEGASSGSPIFWNVLSIGIHTNGGCTSSGGSNSGTSFELNELESFINGVTGTGPEFVDAGMPIVATPDGTIFRPWTTVVQGAAAVPTGGNLSIVAGSYPGAVVFNRAMRVTAPVGNVVIGQ